MLWYDRGYSGGVCYGRINCNGRYSYKVCYGKIHLSRSYSGNVCYGKREDTLAVLARRGFTLVEITLVVSAIVR